MKILVLGAGKMAEALIKGLTAVLPVSTFHVFSPSGISAANLCSRIGCIQVKDLGQFSNPDYVLVTCKPQQLVELAKTLGGQFKEAVFLSVLIAVPESKQISVLGVKKLVRLMPNLPVEFGQGVTLIASHSAKEKLSEIQDFLKLTGLALVVKEEELEELTILVGSGPGLFYELIKNLAASFKSLNETEREALARKVASGVGLTLDQSQKSLSELTGNVTSKGGVTIAVLEHWRKQNLAQAISDGVSAGKKRIDEIRASQS